MKYSLGLLVAVLCFSLSSQAYGKKHRGGDYNPYLNKENIVNGGGYQQAPLYRSGPVGQPYEAPNYGTQSQEPVYFDQQDPYSPQDESVYVEPYSDSNDPYQQQASTCPPAQPHRPSEEDIKIARRASELTNGKCDFRTNPHSYACNKITFEGKLFPLYDIQWDGELQGEWFTATYANPWNENDGDQFFMAKNPSRSQQPDGVANVATNQLVGAMWINGKSMGFENWQGQKSWSIPQTFKKIGLKTVKFMMNETDSYQGQVVHSFNCRDFNRNDKHHLLCAWDVAIDGGPWEHHGYFGFLTRVVWQDFLQCGRIP